MSKAAMNLQDSFLNQVRRENSEVRVLLVNGTLLRGTVKGFDNFTLILNNRNGQHLIYKHAIAQIVTQRPHVRTEDLEHGDTPENTEAASSGTPEDVPKAEKTERHQGSNKPSGSHKSPRPERKDGEGSRQKTKKDGFNTLDLSGVKLGDNKEK